MEANTELGSDFLHVHSPEMIQIFRSLDVMTPLFQSVH